MMKEIFIDSKRGSKIPVSLYEGDGSKGILLMAHSFRSEKEEDGRYVWLGEKLSQVGFICMAPDFPGNGKSEEPFQNYSLTSCLEDLECCYAYLKKEYVFDPEKAALLGYSMGGRIISLVGYSAMAGTAGGGGMGALAIRYGYPQYKTDILVVWAAD